MPADADAFGASLDLFRMDSGWDRLLNAGAGMEANTHALCRLRPTINPRKLAYPLPCSGNHCRTLVKNPQMRGLSNVCVSA